MATTQPTIRQTLLRADIPIIAAALALVVATAYFPVSVMVNRWFVFDEAYSHGLFVAGAALFLMYRVLRRHHFPLNPSYLGIALAALTSMAIAMASVVNVLILQQIGAVFLWWAIIVALLGWRAGWHLAIPIGFIYYAVPIWDYLTNPLVHLAVVVNEFLLGFRGIHFQVDGVFIRLLDVGTFEVAGGCSGLRYLVVALTLSTLFSALNFTRAREWIALHATAIIMALLVNWIRIFVIILMGYETNMQTGLIDDHEFFGWVLFVVALVPFFYIANRLMNRSPEPTPSQSIVAGHHSTNTSKAALAAVATITLVAGPALYAAAPSIAGTQHTISLPDTLGDWQRTDESFRVSWEPTMRRADQVLQAPYRTGGDSPEVVNVGIWHYQNQTQGSELVQYQNRLVDNHEWRVLERRNAAANGWQTMILEHRRQGEIRAVTYSYFVANTWTSSDIMVKALMLRGALQGSRKGTLVTLEAPCADTTCAQARDSISASLQDRILPAVERPLRGK